MDTGSFNGGQFTTQPAENSPEYFKDQITSQTKNPKSSIVFFPFPEEMESEGSRRRKGVDTGSSIFFKQITQVSFSLITPLKIDLNFDWFEELGYDPILHEGQKFRENFSGKFEEAGKGNQPIFFAVGGGSNIAEIVLNSFEESELENTVLVKISPFLGIEEIKENGQILNENFFGKFLKGKFEKMKIGHFGLIDYKTTMDNYRKAMDHNHFVSFMDDETIIANLGKYVEENSQKKNLIFLIDCEAFSSDYFQGVSDPNIDGLSKEQAYNLASFLASLDSLKAVLISNYNPTVEKFRSSKFLSSFVYKFVKTLNSKAQ